MKIWFILLLSLGLVTGCSNAAASDTTKEGHSGVGMTKAFPALTWIGVSKASDDLYSSRLGYIPQNFKLMRRDLNRLPKDDLRYDAENDDDYTLLGEYKIDSMPDAINIFYSDGPSADPEFMLSDSNNKVIWEIGADELAILPNGIIYTSGHSNKMFDKKQKFQLYKGKVKEIKQPFFYVGYKDKLLSKVSLYSQKVGGEVVAYLPAGSEIEVLLAESDLKKDADGWAGLEKNYLVRTPFGLVGWMRLTDEQTYGEPAIKYLRYWGD